MKSLILLSTLVFFSSCVIQKTIEESGSHESKNRFDDVFNSMIENGFTGALLIAEKGVIKYSRTYGRINLTDSLLVNEKSVFELASISKQFTASAVALLEQENKLSRNDPITKYLPELKKYQSVLIKHLIHHTSGIAEYDNGDWVYNGKEFITNDSIINYLTRVGPELKFPSGSQFEYSNTGYVLLASIIEKVSGLTYNEFLKSHFFTPSSMFRTQIYRPRYSPEEIDNYAIGFVYSDSLRKEILPDFHSEHEDIVYLDGIQGDVKVNSTIGDLFKWDRVLYTNDIFKSKTKRKMFRINRTSNGSINNYGYGWQIFQDRIFGKILNHSGGWPGYVTFMERHIDHDKVIIILQNNYNNFKFPIKSIRSILYNDRMPKPKLSKYIGVYKFEDDETIMILSNDNFSLFGELRGSKFKLIPIRKNIFFIEEKQDVELEFIKGKKGKMSEIRWHQDNYIGHFKKIE